MKQTLYGGISDNVPAYCDLHKRSMTTKQLKKKQCLGKQCFHLRKNEDHPYWQLRERMKDLRRERKLQLVSDTYMI